MADSAKYNENYVHSCDSQLVAYSNYEKAIFESGYSYDEFKMIYDFYLAHAPLKRDGNEKVAHIRWLGEYGWKSTNDLRNLERLLLKIAEIPSFCILKSDSLDNTVVAMNLKDKICIEHPRAVMLTEKEVKVNEIGEVSITTREKRLVCLFRHIRNALAHGQTYVFDNGSILLEDKDGERVTFRMLINKSTLIEWIKIIDKDQLFYKFSQGSQKNEEEN